MALEYGPNDDIAREILIDSETIEKRVGELGQILSNDYYNKKPVLVGVLKGSFIFLADLIRELDPDLQAEVDFMAVSSYKGTVSSREPKIEKDLSINIDGRHVIVFEDIVDTGYSFYTLLRILSARNPASLKTCALLSKPNAREIEVPIDYLGFEIENEWVEGYGLDTNQQYRGLPDLWARK